MEGGLSWKDKIGENGRNYFCTSETPRLLYVNKNILAFKKKLCFKGYIFSFTHEGKNLGLASFNSSKGLNNKAKVNSSIM